MSPRQLSRRPSRRLSAADRIRRNAQILADRAGGEPVSTIAERHDLTTRQVRSICNDGETPVVQTTIERSEALAVSVLADYEKLRRDLDRLSTSRRDPNTQLGAIKAKISVVKQQTDFLLATGLISRDLSAIDYERDAVELAETLLEVLEEQKVPWEVQNALIEAVEARKRAACVDERPSSGSKTSAWGGGARCLKAVSPSSHER